LRIMDRRIVKDQARRSMILKWSRTLEDPNIPGKRTVEAIRPCLSEWIDGVKREGITYRMTQVHSGHGCFGEFLCRIGEERTAECHHCDHLHDLAQHTLEACPAWAAERAELVVTVGADLSLSAVIRAMVGGRGAWKAVSSFCGRVMLQKEDAEREKRGEGQRRAAPSPPKNEGRMPPPIGPPPRRRRHRSPHRPPPRTNGGEMTSTGGGDPVNRPPRPRPRREERVLLRGATTPRSSTP